MVAASAIGAAAAVTRSVSEMQTLYESEDGDLKGFQAKLMRGFAVHNESQKREMKPAKTIALELCLKKCTDFNLQAKEGRDAQRQWKMSRNSVKWLLGQFDKALLENAVELDRQISLVMQDPDYLRAKETGQDFPETPEEYISDIPCFVDFSELPPEKRGKRQATEALLQISAKDLFEKNGIIYEHTRPSKSDVFDFFNTTLRAKGVEIEDVEWDPVMNCLKGPGVTSRDNSRVTTIMEILAEGDPKQDSAFDRAERNANKIQDKMEGCAGAVFHKQLVSQVVTLSGGGSTLDWFHEVQENCSNTLTCSFGVAQNVAMSVILTDLATILDSAFAARNLREAKFHICEFITHVVKKKQGATSVTLFEFKFDHTLSEEGIVTAAMTLSTITVVVTAKASPQDFLGEDSD